MIDIIRYSIIVFILEIWNVQGLPYITLFWKRHDVTVAVDGRNPASIAVHNIWSLIAESRDFPSKNIVFNWFFKNRTFITLSNRARWVVWSAVAAQVPRRRRLTGDSWQEMVLLGFNGDSWSFLWDWSSLNQHFGNMLFILFPKISYGNPIAWMRSCAA